MPIEISNAFLHVQFKTLSFRPNWYIRQQRPKRFGISEVRNHRIAKLLIGQLSNIDVRIAAFSQKGSHRRVIAVRGISNTESSQLPNAFGSRHARSNGSRHARGATSWWMAFGPHEPGA